jgi:hypothetical protein
MSPAQRIRESGEVVKERGGDEEGGEEDGGEGEGVGVGQGKAWVTVRTVPLPNVRKVFANLEKGESDLRLQADMEEFVRIRHASRHPRPADPGIRLLLFFLWYI